MNKVISLKTKELLQDGIVGIGWIMVGFTQIFQCNIIIELVVVIGLLIASLLGFVPYFVETEIEDEMANYNEDKAMSMTYMYFKMVLIICVMICTIISILKKGCIIDFKLVLPFLLGTFYVLKFIFFVSYEKVGD